MDLALARSAVLVRPNYRKLPESTGPEILANLAAFWEWFRGGLRASVASATAGAVEVDGSRTLLIGHSAGMCGHRGGCVERVLLNPFVQEPTWPSSP